MYSIAIVISQLVSLTSKFRRRVDSMLKIRLCDVLWVDLWKSIFRYVCHVNFQFSSVTTRTLCFTKIFKMEFKDGFTILRNMTLNLGIRHSISTGVTIMLRVNVFRFRNRRPFDDAAFSWHWLRHIPSWFHPENILKLIDRDLRFN